MKGKTIALVLTILIASVSFVSAQDVNSSQYQAQKEALIGVPHVEKSDVSKAPVRQENSILFLSNCPESDRPTCLKEPFDATAPGWVVSMARNDDGSSASIPLPFSFNLYGTSFNSIFINNNGNVTFTSPLSTFTPFAFPSSPRAIIAPFFADVDTRPAASGVVYHKIESNRITIVWDSVGYFANRVDKRNTFQLIMSDGTDPLLGLGNNVCFSYGDMAWTTGDASGGIGGFLGAAATVGVNKGDGVTFATLGRFNRPGSYYGGPSVDTNGVSYLDCQSFCLNVSNVNNICPVPQGFPTDTVVVTCGTPYTATYSMTAPETNQTVEGSALGVPSGMSVQVTGGLTATFDVTINWSSTNPPDSTHHTVCFRGIDSFNPPCTTTVCVVYKYECALPVELSSFTSTVNGRNVELNWATAEELNNSGFDVERSVAGTSSWAKIGFVAGNGTTSEAKSYSFSDRGLATGDYSYRLKQIDYNGNFEYFNLSNEVIIGVPTAFDLGQNYPNPFNPSTKIDYAIPFEGKVSLTIFDNSGREVAKLVNGNLSAGYYTASFDASSLSSGVYYYRLSISGTSNFTETKRMMLVK